VWIAAINLFQVDLDNNPWNYLFYDYERHLRHRFPPFERSGGNFPPLWPRSSTSPRVHVHACVKTWGISLQSTLACIAHKWLSWCMLETLCRRFRINASSNQSTVLRCRLRDIFLREMCLTTQFQLLWAGPVLFTAGQMLDVYYSHMYWLFPWLVIGRVINYVRLNIA